MLSLRKLRPAGTPRTVGESIGEVRTERLIAVCRIVMALSTLVVFVAHPPSSAGHARTLVLVGSLLACSVALARLSWRVDIMPTRLKITVHALDGASALGLVALTGGTHSAFAPYLSFPVLFASLRWPSWGVLWTGVVIVVAFLVMGLAEFYVGDAGFTVDAFVIRAAFLSAVGGMLAWVGVHERRARREITALARRHGGISDIGDLLRMMSAAVAARRAAVAWTDRDSSLLRVEYWTGTELTGWQEADRTPESLVAPGLAGADFLWADTAAADPIVLVTVNGNGTVARRRGAPMPPDTLARFDGRRVLGVRLQGAVTRGRLFLLDMPDTTADTLLLGSILASQLEVHLDEHCLASTRVSDERLRLARNVHDGVMQSLTGIGLQLEAARRAVGPHSEEAERLLRELQDTVLAEHRELRKLVRQLQEDRLTTYEHDVDLVDAITALVLRVERQWKIRVKVETPLVFEQFDSHIPIAMAREVYYIVREALVNAARHAGAETVAVSLGIDGGHVWVIVVDDGQGFPFQGRYDLHMLMRHDMGPAVLRQRVRALGGTLALDSTRAGSRLHITIPLTVSLARPGRS